MSAISAKEVEVELETVTRDTMHAIWISRTDREIIAKRIADRAALLSAQRPTGGQVDGEARELALETIARTTFSGSEQGEEYIRGNRDAHAACASMAKAALAVRSAAPSKTGHGQSEVPTASPKRITGCVSLVEEAACLIWSELCPGMVMGDDDLPHYEAAAKAVLALASRPATSEREVVAPDREQLARLIWDQKPDCGGLGKPWPFDGKTPKEIRTIKHDMPAALELCFLYADIGIKYFVALPASKRSASGAEGSPDPLGFIDAMSLAERGLEIWKSKEHNAKWWRKIDGTPIPNDLLVNIAEEFAKCGLVYASSVPSAQSEAGK